MLVFPQKDIATPSFPNDQFYLFYERRFQGILGKSNSSQTVLININSLLQYQLLQEHFFYFETIQTRCLAFWIYHHE
jgi:hypothetical protein